MANLGGSSHTGTSSKIFAPNSLPHEHRVPAIPCFAVYGVDPLSEYDLGLSLSLYLSLPLPLQGPSFVSCCNTKWGREEEEEEEEEELSYDKW